MIAMEERALNWFQWWEEKTKERSWECFKTALVRRFQPELVQNPFGPMLSIKQTGRVMEYREQFELVVAPLRNTDEEMLKGIFINGLIEEVKAELKLYPSTSLSELMDLAQLLEEKNTAMRSGIHKEDDKKYSKEQGGTMFRHLNWVEAIKERTSPMQSRTPGGTLSENKQTTERTLSENKLEESPKRNKTWEGGQRLTQADVEERSKKGLCFKCGNKWGKEHVCGMKHYQFVLMEEPEEETGTSDQQPELDGAANSLKSNARAVSYYPP
ncbi:unnamed protein product [Cuscuta epithymum]|uniref:Ty3 transposon capsid-like protein domain-containing protein n=1 Tax=Cuscuta epithymum TaxID=186058 RepID=A0AAV0G2S6_9ASTE|nr:unnamed protein product [Cuscuta epithymum]CAH9142019.1 unnamed protein product [Cuscuta epithymum]